MVDDGKDTGSITFKEKYNECTTWQEKAVLISLYHTAMCLRYKTWTITDTSLHFEVSIGLVSENIRLAKEMDGGKNAMKILNSKTREEGLKLIDRRHHVRIRTNSPMFKYRKEED